MTWELCDGTSEHLVDLWGGCDESVSWQTAKKHFRDKGYYGKFLLIERHMTGFKLYVVNIERNDIKKKPSEGILYRSVSKREKGKGKTDEATLGASGSQ